MSVPAPIHPTAIAETGIILGAYVSPHVRVANVRTGPGLKYRVAYKAIRDEIIGRVERVRKTEEGYWLGLKAETTPTKEPLWVHFNVIKISIPKSKTKDRYTEAKSILQKSIETDKAVFVKLLDINHKLSKISDSKTLRNKVRQIIERYNKRQERKARYSFWKKVVTAAAMINPITSFATKVLGYSMSYVQKLYSWWKKNVSIGAAVPVGYIVAVVVGGAITAAIVYFISSLLADAREAARDYAATLKIDQEIQKILKQLTNDDKEKVESYIRDVAEKSYYKGYQQGSFSGILKSFFPLLLIGGGVYLGIKLIADGKN